MYECLYLLLLLLLLFAWWIAVYLPVCILVRQEPRVVCGLCIISLSLVLPRLPPATTLFALLFICYLSLSVCLLWI